MHNQTVLRLSGEVFASAQHICKFVYISLFTLLHTLQFLSVCLYLYFLFFFFLFLFFFSFFQFLSILTIYLITSHSDIPVVTYHPPTIINIPPVITVTPTNWTRLLLATTVSHIRLTSSIESIVNQSIPPLPIHRGY